MADTPDTCAWTRPDPDPDAWSIWDTACDHEHLFDSGGPVEDEHRFCPYCGGKLVEGGEE